MQLTLGQAAKLLHVSESMVLRWIRDRRLPAVRFNEQTRLNRVDLLVWAQANRIILDPEDLAIREPTPASAARALVSGGIHRDVAGDDRRSVVQAAVDRLPLPAGLDRVWLQQMLAAREARGATLIGNGIAIPHVRCPIVLPVDRPLLALCFLGQAIDFGAADGVGVQALFVLVSPTIRTHLNILARLSFGLGGEFGRRVAARAGNDELISALRLADREAPPAPSDPVAAIS